MAEKLILNWNKFLFNAFSARKHESIKLAIRLKHEYDAHKCCNKRRAVVQSANVNMSKFRAHVEKLSTMLFTRQHKYLEIVFQLKYG